MSIADKTKKLWIEKGYEHFALYGPENLSINKISKEIGSSRASFYHQFGDNDIFIDELLEMHWQICQQFISVGKKEYKKLFPDLYLLLAKNPIPLQFNRQIFINRRKPVYNYVFAKTYSNSAKYFILKLFSKQFNLNYNDEDIYDLWFTIGESWYSRLEPADLSAEKMQQLAQDILNSVLKFVSSDLYSTIHRKTSN